MKIVIIRLPDSPPIFSLLVLIERKKLKRKREEEVDDEEGRGRGRWRGKRKGESLRNAHLGVKIRNEPFPLKKHVKSFHQFWLKGFWIFIGRASEFVKFLKRLFFLFLERCLMTPLWHYSLSASILSNLTVNLVYIPHIHKTWCKERVNLGFTLFRCKFS